MQTKDIEMLTSLETRLVSLIFVVASVAAAQSATTKKDIPAIARSSRGAIVTIIMAKNDLRTGAGSLVMISLSPVPLSTATRAAGRSPFARAAGATDEEIREAVGIAATERYWSTMLNGLQTDFDTFKAEFGPLVGIEGSAK